ncbi:glycosyltransferase family 25 protein [Sessilibacter sp. MAH2]
MKLAVITLNPKSEPVQLLTESLLNQGLIVDEYYAVDGRETMPAMEKGEILDQKLAMFNRRWPLTKTEVGCYLSHLRIIRNAYESGESHLCILEDDVIVEPELAEVLAHITALDDSAHFVRLMALKRRKRKWISALTDKYSLTRPLRGSLGTQGYVLNRVGMGRVLKYASVISMPIDKFYDSFFLYGLNAYTVEPHVIHERHESSSIIKTEGKVMPGIFLWMGHRLLKLYRSLHRTKNYLLNYSHYNPAQYPNKDISKSSRFRD